MSTYIIGDIHGCYHELILLLRKVNFSPEKDVLWLTGDLVSRGPNSLEVLRYVKSLGNSVRIVLGNHDLNLLAIYVGINYNNVKKDSIASLLEAPDAVELFNWLRLQPLLHIDEEKKLVMTHAGITPQWDLNTAKKCAHDIEAALASDSYSFFKTIYRDIPNNWSQNLNNIERLRFIFSAFTFMRYCFPNGKLDTSYKDVPEKAPKFLKPWFSIPNMITEEYSIAFGHWASLQGKGTPKGIYAMDTGCCWGGVLTCLRWEDKTYFIQPSNQKRNLNI